MITVAERKSRFGAITVFKTKKTRSLVYVQGDCFQSEADADGISLVAYIHAMFGLLRQAGSKTVLMIGCGGGTLATMLSSVHCELTVVDIDPHAFLLARRYFRFPPDINCRVADGCQFLLSETGTFDAVVHDAFMAGSIPDHLKSSAFFSLVRARLKPSGSVFVNVHVENDLDHAADRMADEMAKVWPDVRILDREGSTHRNAIVMAGGVLDLKSRCCSCAPRWTPRRLSASWTRWSFVPGRPDSECSLGAPLEFRLAACGIFLFQYFFTALNESLARHLHFLSRRCHLPATPNQFGLHVLWGHFGKLGQHCVREI
jgi:protein-L-isoaspartate O-methyltransferase